MPTPVVMPQMGESIAEGTIVRWIKKIGDAVDRDEPLFEISTDKVDAEIPSPAAGVLIEIAVREGETVPVNSVVATIGQEGEAPAPASTPKAGAVKAAASTQAQGDGQPSLQPGSASHSDATDEAPQVQESLDSDTARRRKSSPLVRRIAKEHSVDISRIPGSGGGGRVTKRDILKHIEERGSDEIRPLSVMRRKIAEHMVMSRRTSAHVHTVFHVNFSKVEQIRRQKKAAYEAAGARLTYMAFIAKAVADALRTHRIVNASLDGENVVYKKDVNIGIAVALESGLIVPVVKQADLLDLLGLSKAIADLAERARSKQLKPEEVHDGTFTITNPGQFGSQFGMPIINQPQLAILGVGTIEKRPVVLDGDAIGIRTMAYLTLGFDHRVIDGAVADQFMADVKHRIEEFDENDA